MMAGFFDYGSSSQSPPATSSEPTPKGMLAGLTAEDWNHLIGFASRRRYPAGGVIIAAGSNQPAVYFLVSGSVRITGSRPGGLDSEIEVLSDNAVFGIQSFLDHRPSAATATAVTATEILTFTPSTFSQFAAWHPRVAIALISDLAANLAARLRHHEVMT